MALDREAIFAALMTRLQGAVPAAKSFHRSVTEWRNASAAKQPALLLLGGDENAQREQPTDGEGLPPTWTLTPSIHVYARNADSKDAGGARAPDVQLNLIAKQIEGAFERQTGELARERWYTTLGGRVLWAFVTGTSRVQGQEQEEAGLDVDLQIVAPGG